LACPPYNSSLATFLIQGCSPRERASTPHAPRRQLAVSSALDLKVKSLVLTLLLVASSAYYFAVAQRSIVLSKLSVTISVCLSVHTHIYKTTRTADFKFSTNVCCDTVLF